MPGAPILEETEVRAERVQEIEGQHDLRNVLAVSGRYPRAIDLYYRTQKPIFRMLNGRAVTLPGSQVGVIGNEPQAFGKVFFWDRSSSVYLIAYINPSDEKGVAIVGLLPGDEVEFHSASGDAWFAKDRGNPAATSIVGVAAVLAEGVATYYAQPEFIPLIEGAKNYANTNFFAASGRAEKRRNAYGVDPANGKKARQEGGIVVCLPGCGGPVQSGDDDHRDRWIQGDGTRTDANLPKHLRGWPVFFPIQNASQHNTRHITHPGELFMLAWDVKHQDNTGHYEAYLRLKKGS